MPDFFERLEEVESIPVFAIADKKLQSVRELPRFMIQRL
jgi:thiamine monophosphate synthase